MRSILYAMLIGIGLTTFSTVFAQQERPGAFNPQRFETDLEQFITTRAGLTPQEAAVFFPLYRAMRKQQRVYYAEGRRFRHLSSADDQACEDAIRKHAAGEIKVKEIQQSYYLQFLRVLPAGKVYKILKAEERFHRQAMRGAALKHDKRKSPRK